MTKTLTEQWRDGTLKNGNYYTVCYKGWSKETFHCNLYYSKKLGFGGNVKEVLAPVPSYDEFERLQKQLNEANKLLLDFCSEDECRFDHNGYCQEHDSCEGEYKCIQKDLKQYLEKWGVK